jgi:hypothetical protein
MIYLFDSNHHIYFTSVRTSTQPTERPARGVKHAFCRFQEGRKTARRWGACPFVVRNCKESQAVCQVSHYRYELSRFVFTNLLRTLYPVTVIHKVWPSRLVQRKRLWPLFGRYKLPMSSSTQLLFSQDEVFWVVTPRNVVVWYPRFGGPYCLNLQGEWDNTDFRNVLIPPRH